MRVLVLNAGSSSLKAAVLDVGPAGRTTHVTDALVERVGEEGGDAPDHGAAVRQVLDRLAADGVHPDAVGHRVVHGGERFTAPAVVDDRVVDEVAACVPLAPLHNPANLAGLRAAREAFADLPHVAVFDTAFHATVPPAAHRYAVPRDWYEQHGVRRYGFHGTSHAYVSRRAAALLGREPADVAVVSAHLGNGASVTAVDGGVSVDTSMGLGPLPGLVMGTRSGDIDPTVVFHLVREAGWTLDAVEAALNRESGLRGLAGSNDLRDVEVAARAGDEHATLALDVLAHRLVGYVGAYATLLGRLDAMVFTAGVGEHSALVRRRVCERLGLLGVTLDHEANEAVAGESRIDGGTGPAVLVVPTDEEGEIARQVVEVLGA
ncbi:MAG: acetate/propionate family kinase [Actinomycetes bacterium]